MTDKGRELTSTEEETAQAELKAAGQEIAEDEGVELTSADDDEIALLLMAEETTGLRTRA